MSTETNSAAKKTAFILLIANFTIALTWIYHGIFPKLLYMETGELSMLASSGVFTGMEREAVYVIGVAEILFGIAFILFGKYKLVHWLNSIALVALGIGAAVAKPDIYSYPFNPATTAFGIMGLSVICLSLLREE